MNENIKKAYSEIDVILDMLDEEYLNKIPTKFINFIHEEKDSLYIPSIKNDVPLEEQKLLEDTINILAMLKLDYWSNEKEKNELLLLLNENEKKYQEELHEKYNPDNLFKKSNKDEIIENENVAMIEYKEPFLKRILTFIKGIFKK